MCVSLPPSLSLSLSVCVCVCVCVRACVRACRRPRDWRLRWSSVGRPRAAGVTWTNRTTSAPWPRKKYGRLGHTSVVDAAGAIYVIGGQDTDADYFNDVWVSTDGGADGTRAGSLVGTYGVLKVYHEVRRRYSTGTHGYRRGTEGVPTGTRGTLGVIRGARVPGGTFGALNLS